MLRLLLAACLLVVTGAEAGNVNNWSLGIKRAATPTPPTDPVTARAPTSFDTSSKGWTTNNLWLYGGVMYQFNGSTWSTLTLAATPLDNIVATPLGAWGTVKLKSAYTGSSIQLTRDSDSTTHDVPFTGNDINVTDADAFCADANCYCTKYYDQTGGGNDLVQATLTKAPNWIANSLSVGSTTGYSVGSKRVCSWNSILDDNTHFNRTDYPPKFMVAASLAWTSGHNTMAMAAQVLNGRDTLQWFGAPDNTENVVNAWNVSASSSGMTMTSAIGQRCSTLMFTSPAVHVWKWNSTNALFCASNNATSSRSTATHNVSKTGFSLGANGVTQASGYNMVAMAAYGDLSSADAQTLRASMLLAGNIQPQSRDFEIIVGASGSSGAQGLQANSWSSVAALSYTRPVTQINGAVFGRPISQILTDLSTNGWLTQYINQVSPTADNIMFRVQAGINDLVGTPTVIEVEDDTKAVVALLKASSPRATVSVGAYVPQDNYFSVPEYLAKVIDYQNWIISSYNVPQPTGAGADSLINFNQSPSLIASPDYSTCPFCVTPTYSGDGNHPTALSNTFLAPYAATVTNAQLAAYP